MSARTSAILVAVGVAALAALAHLPLLRAGLRAADYEALLEAGGEATSVPAWRSPAVAPPLARLSIGFSRSLAGRAVPSAAALRGENLLWLAGAALALAFATRRLLLPWTGSEHARAAGWSAAAILVVHPLAVSAVADVGARDELLGAFFGFAGLALFLRGRQDRVQAFTVAALFACVLAGLSAELALGLPFLYAGAELLSSHRYRPMRVRLRTATTTFVLFGVAASLDLVLQLGRLGSGALPSFVQSLRGGPGDGFTAQLSRAVEKLGLLVLPANPFVTELAGLALSGAIFLLAMHPGLAAARSAPRLWGWVLFGWFVALLWTELFHLDVVVTHADFSRASVLLPSAAVMAVGLAVGATALSGPRRFVYPCLVAAGYAALAHANALPWRGAAREVESLAAHLRQAQELHGRDVRILVIDPPRAARGVEPVGDAVAALVHPAWGDRRGAGGPPPEVRGVTGAAFLALVREPELGPLVREPLVVSFPLAALGEATTAAAQGGRHSLLLRPPEPSGRPLSWRGGLRSPNLDVSSLGIGCLLVRAPRDAAPDPEQRVSWRPGERAVGDGRLPGVWYVEGSEARAVFDLGGSLAWRLGDRIKRIWFEGGLRVLDEAELAEELPGLGPDVVPRVDGGDWLFALPGAPLVERLHGRGLFVVGLLDLESLDHREIPALPDRDGGLRVEGAAEHVARVLVTTGGPVAWSLDLRVDGHAVARARGRRVERTGGPGDGEG